MRSILLPRTHATPGSSRERELEMTTSTFERSESHGLRYSGG